MSKRKYLVTADVGEMYLIQGVDAMEAGRLAESVLTEGWSGARITGIRELSSRTAERFVRLAREVDGDMAEPRAAVEALLDCPDRLAVVLAGATAAGGVDRAIAVVSGASKGLVHKVLRDRGLKVQGGKLVEGGEDN